MSKKINISLKAKETPSIDFKLGDEVRNIVSPDAPSPVVTFVATGEKGEQGVDGTASIDNNSVTNLQILDGTITSAQIQNYTISTNDIGAYQITSAKLSTNSVVTDKINDDAVTGAKIADNSIGPEHIINGTITKELINDLELSSDKLENNSITTIKVQDEAITKEKIANKTISGAQIMDDVVLGGVVHVTYIKIDGGSPGYIYGPSDDILYIQSNKDLILKCDADQTSNPSTSFIKFQNAGGSDLFTVDESGNAVLAGNLTLTGNVIVNGTVDGVNVAEALSVTQAQTTKINYITVTQPVDLDAMEAKLDGITDNEAIDWTVDQGGTNIHVGNYTDTNTQNTTTLSFVDSTDDIILRNTTGGAGSGTDDIKFVAGANITLTYTDADNITIASTDTNTTYSIMGPGNSYAAGLVPEGSASHAAQFLRKDGAWVTPPDTNTTYVEATSSYMGLMSSAHHDKLDGIEDGAEVNVQSDWNSSSGDSQILNKPTIPVDLTSDGAGTIHANNVPTLNQDTTGNATTATNLTAGDKTIAGKITAKGLLVDANVSLTPSGDGVAVHVDSMDVTDNNTSASGTATIFNHITFENPRLLASNSSVTTTNASTVYIKGAPVAHTNQTITNPYALYIQGGASYFGGAITASAGVTGDLTGNADTATNLVASTSTAVQLGTIELGHASDTTIHRTHAGRVAIEGNEIQTTNKHRHFINFGINLAFPYSRWIPIGSYYIFEQNTDSNPEYTTYVAPHDGKFIKALVRSEEALGDTELKIYKVGDGTEEPDQGSVVDDKHVDIASANTSYTYTFDSDATFSAGDAIAVRIDPTNDPVAAGVVGTFCLEFDLTT